VFALKRYVKTLSVRLSEEDSRLYAKILSFYNAVTLSRLKTFRLLLKRRDHAIEEKLQREYWAQEEIEAPVEEPGEVTNVESVSQIEDLE
jgi:hypothetical protein